MEAALPKGLDSVYRKFNLKNKAQYYECLRRVTESSAWIEWISYMLDAVEVTAKETQG